MKKIEYIIIFEDKDTYLLEPFSVTHASFEIQCGLKTNLERIMDIYGSDYKYILLVRPEIESIICERYPEIEVNPEQIPKGKYINGAFAFKQKIDLNQFPDCITSVYPDKLIDCQEIVCFQKIWDQIFCFGHLLEHDYEHFDSYIEEKSNLYKKYTDEPIIIANSSRIKEGAILDASNGPIIIGENVTVDIGALLQGPLFIDNNSYISLGAKIRSGTMIGKNCKVGGEVANSIFYKNSNKVHDGFIGHSFIGEWVNIGAGTNNSNLKNNYSSIKFNFGNGEFNTNEQFLGFMIGDFTTIGISTMLNSGTYIGIGCNVFGSGFQKKHIPSFSWGKLNEKYQIEKLIESINRMQKRRNTALTRIETDFLRKIYKYK